MYHFGLPITEAPKISGSVSKHVMSHTKNYTMRKHMVLEIVKCIPRFASLKNDDVTVHNCFLSFH